MIRYRMTAYRGFARETGEVCEVEDLGGGAGRTTCFECGGAGNWSRFHPEGEPTVCVECKGTGRVLISI